MEIKATIPEITNLEVKTKIKQFLVEGGEKGETEGRLITTVKFEYEGTAAAFEEVLHAVAERLRVTADFSSSQMTFEMATK